MSVPDAVGEVTGYRGFTCHDRKNLHSLARRYTWQPGKNIALCDPGHDGIPNRRPHLSPDPSCGCGFWMLNEPQDVVDLTMHVHVIAKVKGWGRVVRAERGNRTQYAEIVSIVAGDGISDETLQNISDRYGVPYEPEPVDWDVASPLRIYGNKFSGNVATSTAAFTVSPGTIVRLSEPSPSLLQVVTPRKAVVYWGIVAANLVAVIVNIAGWFS